MVSAVLHSPLELDPPHDPQLAAQAANRLVVGVITAALVVGSSIVMHSVGAHSSAWLLSLGVAGFVGAALCGVWIVLSIWRSARH